MANVAAFGTSDSTDAVRDGFQSGGVVGAGLCFKMGSGGGPGAGGGFGFGKEALAPGAGKESG